MAKQAVEALVDGGKASAAPPLGPALGPLGVNIGQIVSEINKKTEAFKGMQVPIKVIVDSSTKEFSIEVGTPPASALIKKEAGLEKGAANPLQEKLADLLIEQIIKIAKMKEDDLGGKTLKQKVKEVLGSCNSMGILVEGVPAKDAIALVEQGKFDAEIKSGKTEVTAEELKRMAEERKHLQEELEKRKAAFLNRANAIMKEMEGKEKNKIRAKMLEEKIPKDIVDQLVPAEKAAAAPATGGKK